MCSMLRLSKTFANREIFSLRTGGKIGHAIAPIIDPNTLKIEGWHALANHERGQFVLPPGEIRELITKGFVVDDHDALTPPEDLVRLKNILEINFELIGKSVETESKKKLGKVTDYAVDEQSYYVKKLYVTPTVLRSFKTEQYLIDRSEIVEINNRKIIVADATSKARGRVAAGAGA